MPAEVDIGRCDVAVALVVALMIVMIDEGFDLGFDVAGQDEVFQRDAVLQGLMPPLNLALGLRMLRCTARVLHALVLQPFSQVAENIT